MTMQHDTPSMQTQPRCAKCGAAMILERYVEGDEWGCSCGGRAYPTPPPADEPDAHFHGPSHDKGSGLTRSRMRTNAPCARCGKPMRAMGRFCRACREGVPS